jgi:hypothetical protein
LADAKVAGQLPLSQSTLPPHLTQAHGADLDPHQITTSRSARARASLSATMTLYP